MRLIRRVGSDGFFGQDSRMRRRDRIFIWEAVKGYAEAGWWRRLRFGSAGECWVVQE